MIYIGIDPDVEKSGVAINSEGIINLFNYNYFELFDFLNNYVKYKESHGVTVVIEKGEMNKAIFNAQKAINKRVAAKIGVSVGRNFEASNIIADMCIYLELDYEFYIPTTAKLSNKVVQKLFKLDQKRTNEEQRDALRCIVKYVYKNLIK